MDTLDSVGFASAASAPRGGYAQSHHSDRATAQPVILCVNWRCSGLDDEFLNGANFRVEHESFANATLNHRERVAAVLVYVDCLDDSARLDMERWRGFRLVVLTKNVDCDSALWALRAGVADIVAVPRELPYLAERLATMFPPKEARRYRCDVDTAKRTHPALQAIGQRFRDRLTVPALASSCNMTTITFLRAFKRENGSTVLAYLNQYRIDRAKQLLVTSSISIKEIALDCGFDDIAYFSRVFRKVEGLPPSAFRSHSRRGK